jgi:hypothetical protein
MKLFKMKKLVFCFLLMISLTVNAQTSRRFSIFADPQLSWFTSDTKKFEPNGSIAGFNIGFTADKYFADRYAIFTGLSINNIGGNLKYKEPGYKLETRDSIYNIAAGSNAKLKAQYLNIPFGLKFKTNEIGYVSFTAQVGVLGSVRLKASVWEDVNKIDKETITQQFKQVFASYFIGAGVEYSLGGPSSLQAGIIYSNGITEAYNAGYGNVSIGSLSLRIGIVF